MLTVQHPRRAFARRNALAACLAVALTTTAGAGHARDPDSLTNPHAAPSGDTVMQALLRAAWADNPLFAKLGTPAARPARATGNVVPVTSCADDGTAGTLRDAFENAADGDVIDMRGLTCSLISLQNGALASPVLNLKLLGPGVDALTIDGNNGGRVLEGTNLDIADLTIAHGLESSNVGGGCVLANGDLSLTHVGIKTCVAIAVADSVGGGAAMVLGNLTMRDSTIGNCRSTAFINAGGGGAVVAGSVTLYDSTISGNTAEASDGNALGGGLVALGDVTLHASNILDNTARTEGGFAYGGGIHVQGAIDVSVLDASTVSGNTAHSDAKWSYGGGINSGVYGVADASLVHIEHSTVSGNTVSSSSAFYFIAGGGVHAVDTIEANYSTLDDNHATCLDSMSMCKAGGGALASNGLLSASFVGLGNATISGNNATGGGSMGGLGVGGGVLVFSAKKVIAHNATIAFNHASNVGGGIVATSPASLPSELISTIVAKNDAANGEEDIAPGPVGNSLTIAGTSNIVMSAASGVSLPANTATGDPGLLPLGDNGGPSATHALSPTSIARDAGANPDGAQCDQRGFPYPRIYGAAPDMGAYEAVPNGEVLFADNFDASSNCL